MESVGFLFRKDREKLGKSIEQVSDETHISKEYIRAIEDNYYEELPGDAYCLGFVKKLARYYGEDPVLAAELYNRAKPQNMAVAAGSNTDTVREKNIPFILSGIFIFIFVAAILAFVIMGKGSPELPVQVSSDQPAAPAGTRYIFRDAFVERKFAENDTVAVILDGKEYDVVFRRTADKVLLGFENGSTELEKGADTAFDLNSDGKNDIRIIIKETDSSEKSVIARFDRALEAPAETRYAEAVSIAPSIIKHSQGTTVILTSSEISPFVLNVFFSGPCFFGSEADGGDRREVFCRADDSISLEADRKIKLLMANGGFVRVVLREHEIFFGNKGEVSVVEIGWEEAENNQYTLSVKTIR